MIVTNLYGIVATVEIRGGQIEICELKNQPAVRRCSKVIVTIAVRRIEIRIVRRSDRHEIVRCSSDQRHENNLSSSQQQSEHIQRHIGLKRVTLIDLSTFSPGSSFSRLGNCSKKITQTCFFFSLQASDRTTSTRGDADIIDREVILSRMARLIGEFQLVVIAMDDGVLHLSPKSS